MSSPVEVVAYDPAWPLRFTKLATALRNGLGDTANRIDHIGSTAVPGLDAKPIVDLPLAVEYHADRKGYMEAKEPYLWTLMRRADRWSQDTGWRPGLSDA